MNFAALETSSATRLAAVKEWESLSFASTLYLRPILDVLLEAAPPSFHDELRLGLQEALVNAAKHGNQLDPKKVVSVRYAKVGGCFWWIVADQGEGFARPEVCSCPSPESLVVSDCGRGLFILHQVFDQVCWHNNGKEIHLAKQLYPARSLGLVSPVFFFRLFENWWRKWSAAFSHSI